MASPSVTYTFTNSTTADATQVNTNFTDLINGASDGTKDYSIAALTCAGAATFNANVTIGNASSDDLTVTASLASTIPIKTTNTYDIGSSTLGLRALYFGANSQTVNIKGSGSMSATWTMTLPVSAGTDTYVLQTNGSGVTSWVSKTAVTKAAKTGAYTLTSADDVILCDASGGAFTLTLPAAASNSGKIFEIQKTDSSTGKITIDGNGSETIKGATTRKLCTQYESVKIMSDGSNWLVLSHECVGPWTSWTPSGSWSSNVTYTGQKRRVGENMEYDVYIVASNSIGTPGQLTVDISETIDTTKFSTAGASKTGLGTAFGNNSGTTYQGLVFYSDTNTVICYAHADGSSSLSDLTHASPFAFDSADTWNLRFTAPIEDFWA